MSNDMIFGRYCREPLATSTPRKSLVSRNQIKNTQSKELTKPSVLLNVLLHQNRQPVEDQENKFVPKPKFRQRESLYFDDVSSSSSDEEEEKLSREKKQPMLKINSSNLKRCIDLKTDSDKIIEEIGLKKKNKSTVNLSSKKATRKASAINVRKNVSATCKAAFKVSPKKNKISSKSPNNSDNLFMFGKLGGALSCMALTDKANTGIKKGEEEKSSNGVGNKQLSLETCFMSIKKNTKRKVKDPVIENKSVNSIKGKPLANTHESSRRENKPEFDNADTENKLQELEGKNQMEIFSSPYNSDKKKKGSVKAGTKTKDRATVDVVPAKRMKTGAKTTLNEDSSKKNSSHQLFSDSKNQELLNSLDLTKEDISDKQNNLSLNVLLSSLMKSKVVPESQPIPVEDTEDAKTSKTNVEPSSKNSDHESSKGQKKECIKNKEHVPISLGSGDIALKVLEEKVPEKESTTTEGDEKSTAITVNYRDYKGKLRKGAVFQNGGGVKKTILKNPSQTLRKTDDGTVQDRVKSDNDQVQSSNVTVKTFKEGTTKNNKNTDDGCSSKNSEVSSSQKFGLPDAFRPLNVLSNMHEFKPGCAVADCWTLKQFKCGMLQLKGNSSHTSKTNDENSYFGGVVVKGSLQMKIGETKMDLKEGDMAFVPPLTVWTVSNIHDLEGLMYYWCGRFRA